MNRNHELVNSFTITEGPSLLQNRYEYNENNDVIYAGYAFRGTEESENVWTIHKFTYDGTNVISKQIAFCAWSDREAGEYL